MMIGRVTPRLLSVRVSSMPFTGNHVMVRDNGIDRVFREVFKGLLA